VARLTDDDSRIGFRFAKDLYVAFELLRPARGYCLLLCPLCVIEKHHGSSLQPIAHKWYRTIPPPGVPLGGPSQITKEIEFGNKLPVTPYQE